MTRQTAADVAFWSAMAGLVASLVLEPFLWRSTVLGLSAAAMVTLWWLGERDEIKRHVGGTGQ